MSLVAKHLSYAEITALVSEWVLEEVGGVGSRRREGEGKKEASRKKKRG